MRTYPMQWELTQCNENLTNAMRTYPMRWELTQCNENLPNAMRTYPMRWELTQCNENLPNAMRTYPMQWELTQCNENLTNAMRTYPMQWELNQRNENLPNAMRTYPMQWELTQCNENLTNAMRTYPVQWELTQCNENLPPVPLFCLCIYWNRVQPGEVRTWLWVLLVPPGSPFPVYSSAERKQHKIKITPRYRTRSTSIRLCCVYRATEWELCSVEVIILEPPVMNWNHYFGPCIYRQGMLII